MCESAEGGSDGSGNRPMTTPTTAAPGTSPSLTMSRSRPTDGFRAVVEHSPAASPAKATPSAPSGTTAASPTASDVLVTVPAMHVTYSVETLTEAYAEDLEFPASPVLDATAALPVPSSAPASPATMAPQAAKPAPTLQSVCVDAFAVIATFCDEGSVLSLAATSHGLRRTLAHLDSVIWRPRCLALWRDKQLFRSAAGRQELPRRVVGVLLRAATIAEPVPEGIVHGLAHSWRAALFLSRRDAKRDFLTDDELFDHHWRVTFNSPGAQNLPPPGPRVFRRVGRVHVVQPVATMPAVPCQLFGGGRQVQVDVFPAHAVERSADWGWRIVNDFVRFETIEPERRKRSPGPELAGASSPFGSQPPWPPSAGPVAGDSDDEPPDSDSAPLGILLQGAAAPGVPVH